MPLIALIDHIYAVNFDWTLFKKLDPIKLEKSKRDTSKYCQYHKEIEHDTSCCYTLKNEIKDLIQRGYLGNFIKDIHEHKKGDHSPLTEEEPEVKTIFRVPTIARDSNKSRNSYAREARSTPLTNILHLEERPNKTS